MNKLTTAPTSARVKTHDGRLYDARLTFESQWAHLADARRLSRHLDGYVATEVGNVTLPAKSIRWIKAAA